MRSRPSRTAPAAASAPPAENGLYVAYRQQIVWNPVFGKVVLDCRFAPELCWPREARQKGAVENLVGWVKGGFFKCRRFHDCAELEAQLAHWLRTVNHKRPSRTTGEIPSVRLEVERVRLRSFAIAPADYALKISVVVSARARVSYEGREYSMPPAAIGQPATLQLYHDRIDIVTKTGEVVWHPRDVRPGQASILPEHARRWFDAVRGVRGRLYYQRQSLWELGPRGRGQVDSRLTLDTRGCVPFS